MDFDWESIEAGFTADELADLRTHEKRREEVHQADMKLQAEISDADPPEIDQALVEWQMPKAVRWPINDRRALLLLVMSLERNIEVTAADEAAIIAPLRRLASVLSAGSNGAPPNGTIPSADGPCGTDGFKFGGTEKSGMPPTAWRLVKFLWDKPDRSADFSDLADPVFGDREEYVTADRVGSARREANACFRRWGFPLKVETSPSSLRVALKIVAQAK
jgi:hypothetical protein